MLFRLRLTIKISNIGPTLLASDYNVLSLSVKYWMDFLTWKEKDEQKVSLGLNRLNQVLHQYCVMNLFGRYGLFQKPD